MENRFKESLLDKDTMSVTWEVVPGRGAREKAQDVALQSAELAVKSGKIHAITITDNPGGNPAIAPDILGLEMLKMGIEPLVHFTCKDKNRNQMESQLYAMDRVGIRNLLVMTGDYPVTGYKGRPKPVFDIDPVHAFKLIKDMNEGLEVPVFKGTNTHGPSDFYSGCAVGPFKANEAELMAQYYKLKKKIAAGAEYIIPNLGYDARKFHELIQFVKLSNLNVPVIANLYVNTFGGARVMNRNMIPGCVVTDKLLAELDEERNAPDKGVEKRMLRAAKMYAFMKGMGYDGVHIGGNLKIEHVEYIVDKGEELSANWMDLIHEFDYPMADGFYYYEKDSKTGLNTTTPTNRKGRPLDAPVGGVYKVSRVFHNLMFEPGKKFFGLMRGVSKSVEGKSMEKLYHGVEHMAKVIMYDCKDCGDCALMDLAYVCPMSQCPKNQRNGACGGSYYGWCEVHPNKKKCIYVQAYSRLKKYGEESQLDSYHIDPCNWDLYQTSSWINFYLGKDHSAGRLGIKKPEDKKS